MCKSKSVFLIAVGLVLLLTGLLFLLFKNPGFLKKQFQDVVFLGPKKNEILFRESSKNAKVFYDLYDKARTLKDAGDYQEAIQLYNQSLSYVALGPEKAMVYSKLAEIYKGLNDLEMELKYVELEPQHSANPQLNEQCYQRAEELRKLITEKKSRGIAQ